MKSSEMLGREREREKFFISIHVAKDDLSFQGGQRPSTWPVSLIVMEIDDAGHRSSPLLSAISLARVRLFITQSHWLFTRPVSSRRFVIDALIDNRVSRDGEQQVTPWQVALEIKVLPGGSSLEIG